MKIYEIVEDVLEETNILRCSGMSTVLKIMHLIQKYPVKNFHFMEENLSHFRQLISSNFRILASYFIFEQKKGLGGPSNFLRFLYASLSA